ncbi:MAG: S-adenosylmethionine:tRNA ribosyltransferase-isomerase, partial [Dehalococcoidia bacterium]|nr:S-adenosylmethionine:tRNA ribosyltransferase-isomerase [Dehalococcoidia bacterium]
HVLPPERFRLPPATADAIATARAEGRRVVATGTTVVRTLEHALGGADVDPDGETDLFIRPGYTFKVVDALLTNFHLPRSTLLMLVSAFAGHELIREAYAEAVRERYRFYSFGDAMLILP